MANEYWDVIQFQERPGRDKAFAQRMGSAKQRDDGGFDVYLNALPLPDAKGCKLVIMPPRERQGGTGSGGAFGRGRTPSRSSTRDDDEIPF